MRMTRTRIGPIKDGSGRLCIELEEIGEVFNEYFSSVFTNERDRIVEEESMKRTGKLEEILVRKEDVLGILKNLRIDKSPGPDGIYPRIMWEAREEIAEQLGVEGWVSKFADYTKIGGVVDSEEGCCRLQRDLDMMQSWAEEWQMEFNPVKCEVFHFGRTNKNAEYRVNGRVLSKVEEQRDLGVYVHRSLKVATQVDKACKKAYGVFAFISRGIEFKSREVMLQLYRTLVRPHLEYCVQFWSF
ncbi:hypothetical protein chiPu_0012732 [Chiloscyllium punctatum]|uniref:Reverse transcriptase domain-containing protein n=1 Tax=Chiloscyllium punctatum TaxID=137246 RepID=A0A401SV39_CHIPU|nr:hypothetical protein [Chiloscyllium punctatum]